MNHRNKACSSRRRNGIAWRETPRGAVDLEGVADRAGEERVLADRRDTQRVGSAAEGQAPHGGRNGVMNVGEAFDLCDWHVEVVDLDGRRIDKILASRRGEQTPA